MMEENAMYDNFVSFCFMYFDGLSLSVWMFVKVISSGCIEHFISIWHPSLLGFPGGSDGKETACNAGDPGLIPGSGRGNGLPTPVYLPGEFHGQRNLLGYSLWGCRETWLSD